MRIHGWKSASNPLRPKRHSTRICTGSYIEVGKMGRMTAQDSRLGGEGVSLLPPAFRGIAGSLYPAPIVTLLGLPPGASEEIFRTPQNEFMA